MSPRVIWYGTQSRFELAALTNFDDRPAECIVLTELGKAGLGEVDEPWWSTWYTSAASDSGWVYRSLRDVLHLHPPTAPTSRAPARIWSFRQMRVLHMDAAG